MTEELGQELALAAEPLAVATAQAAPTKLPQVKAPAPLPARTRQAAPNTSDDEDVATKPMHLGLTLALTAPRAAELNPPAHDATPLVPVRTKEASDSSASSAQPGEPDATVVIARNTVAPLNMRALQPLLAELVEALQSGSSVKVRQWIERTAPQSSSASAFASTYQMALGGGRVVGLGQVTFTPRATSWPQQVDGTVQLNLQYTDQPATVRSLRLRAYFDAHPGGPKLSHLEAR